MKTLKLILFFIVLLGFEFHINANEKAAVKGQAQWVNVAPNKDLYVEYYAPQKNKPTVILIHGLTYTTRQWAPFIKELTDLGLGVVCYDMEGMGQTLLKYAPVKAIIPITNQATDLAILLKKLKIPKPYNLIGLSYGGGVAFNFAIKFPTLVNNMILMAPYTKPLAKVDAYIKSQVAAARLINPWNPYSDDDIYEFFFRQFVYATYPNQEPIVLENPYKLEAVFRLSEGVGAFVPEDHTSELKVRAHLMIPDKDQYFPIAEYEHFWSLFPKESQINLIYIKNSEHKIPEAQPKQAAKYVQQILQ